MINDQLFHHEMPSNEFPIILGKTGGVGNKFRVWEYWKYYYSLGSSQCCDRSVFHSQLWSSEKNTQFKKKIGQFVKLESLKTWFDLVKKYVCYACQTRDIYLMLPYTVDFKAPGERWNPLSMRVFSKCNFD